MWVVEKKERKKGIKKERNGISYTELTEHYAQAR